MPVFSITERQWVTVLCISESCEMTSIFFNWWLFTVKIQASVLHLGDTVSTYLGVVVDTTL